ncbi:hypothetical protein AB0M43_37055 [Longispora sp. NPDC051575]|uniref:hypothetical protein n=1 Tax=Longispora sp. NPDC051575 TaxID=3154943 RepID=UPI0034279C30
MSYGWWRLEVVSPPAENVPFDPPCLVALIGSPDAGAVVFEVPQVPSLAAVVCESVVTLVRDPDLDRVEQV